MNKIERIQDVLEVTVDGIWGPESQAALDLAINARNKPYMASSFADPADVEAFKRCKAQGKTDKQCFAVGDNGIGQFGENTAQTHTPMCALHADDMIALYGSIAKAAHKKIRVTHESLSVICSVEDRMSVRKRVDLNPAAAQALGLRPPFLVPITWEPV